MSEQEWGPGRLLELSGNYWESCTLHAAVSLEVFTAIGEEQLAGEEIARRLGTNPRATFMLLNALAAMGLLAKQGDRYLNTEASRKYLVKESSSYLGHMIMHHHHLVDAWAQLPQAVTMGRPVEKRSYGEEKERESFLMGMFNLAMNIAPQVAQQIDLSGRRHLLDLGGGPGTYAIHFCLANPGLKATVYDLPTTKPFALKTIKRFGLSQRIDFVGGDYTQEDIPGKYDAAWLSHILHGEGPQTCRDILKKTASSLEPGGVIMVHDFILEDTLDRPLFPAIFSLNMLLNTEQGQSYSQGQIREMLALAGVREIRWLPFRGPNESSIMVGMV